MTYLTHSEQSRRAALVLGSVAWFAVLLSLGNSLAADADSLGDIFRVLVGFSGFLTIWTNTAIAVVLTVPLVWPNSTLGRFFRRPGVLTALAAAITIVGVSYELLLRQSWGSPGIDLLTNLLTHYLIPVGFVAFWLAFTPKADLTWRGPFYWVSYMIGYSLWVIVRGELTGQYPYPFVDVTDVGYPDALAAAAGFSILFVIVAMGYVGLGRLLTRST